MACAKAGICQPSGPLHRDFVWGLADPLIGLVGLTSDVTGADVRFVFGLDPVDTSSLNYQIGYGATVVGTLGLARLATSRAPTTTAVSEVRYTQPGETFIRYESANPAFSRMTPSGGVTPGTFAAPVTDGVIPVGQRSSVYNLPNPLIPRPNAFTVTPPAGTPVIGPRTVVGGTGNEVIFPLGF